MDATLGANKRRTHDPATQTDLPLLNYTGTGKDAIQQNRADSPLQDTSTIKVEHPKLATRVYRRRFYILTTYCVASILQVIVWNTWAPIAETTFTVLDWTQADIALLSMWGGIISAVVCIPFAGIMDKYGIRTMLLLAETFAVIGAGVRCIPVPVGHMKWTANIGQFFIALAGPFLVQGPPLISAAWFPHHQRTTATAVATTSMGLGIALSFIVGPLMLDDITTVNLTLVDNGTSLSDGYLHIDDMLDSTVKEFYVRKIYRILYIEFGVLLFLYILLWIYFPNKPPHPPSVSASMPREKFIPGAKKLFRSINSFWLPAFAYSISIGISGTWATQLVIMFDGTVGLDQNTVSWIAFYTYIGGVIGAFLMSRWVDYIGGKMKLVLLFLKTPAIAIFIWFLLICFDVIRFNLVSLYISVIAYGFIVKSTQPIYIEMICEGVYPVAEGITVGTLNWMSNIIGLVYLFVMTIPNIGVMWMNWTVLGSIISAFIFLLIFKENDRRLKQDKTRQIIKEEDVREKL